MTQLVFRVTKAPYGCNVRYKLIIAFHPTVFVATEHAIGAFNAIGRYRSYG